MRKYIFLAAMACTTAFASCGGDDNDEQPVSQVTITCQPEALTPGAEGGTYTLAVGTTGVEWGAYSESKWIEVSTRNSASQQGSVIVDVAANPTTDPRVGTIVLMSGMARKTIEVSQAAAAKAAINVPEGYTMVWNDEFDSGSELNPDDWTHEVQRSGWVNNELQNYVNHKTPEGSLVTELRNGTLRIRCLKEGGMVYSGRVYAHVNEGWQYGYFEARIKLPSGKGTWPAFWMMPVGNDWNTNPWPMCGEIDIMEEVGANPDYVSSSLHTQDYNHTKNTQKTHEMEIKGAEGGFHTYALEWTADAITTYVDGQVQLSVTKSQMGSSHNQWPFHYAFYPILNLAWGGDWGGYKGIDEEALPVTMEVDYLRVFQKK